MQEKYACTFLEGDWADFAEKLAKDKESKGSAKHAQLVQKHKFVRGD
jgi:hypothetical protein